MLKVICAGYFGFSFHRIFTPSRHLHAPFDESIFILLSSWLFTVTFCVSYERLLQPRETICENFTYVNIMNIITF